jgi:hypothetical protein
MFMEMYLDGVAYFFVEQDASRSRVLTRDTATLPGEAGRGWGTRFRGAPAY